MSPRGAPRVGGGGGGGAPRVGGGAPPVSRGPPPIASSSSSFGGGFASSSSSAPAGGVDQVKRVIIDSNPLMEAFGNAKTGMFAIVASQIIEAQVLVLY
jgi:hypothetical protein